MSNVKKKAKLTLSSSKVGSVSSIGTTSPIEIDDEKEHVSTNPINIEDGDNDSDDNKTERSWVWPHFKKYKVVTKVMVDGVMTAVVKRKAKCNHCPRGDYAIGSKSHGTKTLADHLNLRCPGFKKDKDKGQSVLTGDKGVMNNMVLRKFSQENTMTALIEMVVVDEMPFSTVDKPGFRKFCSIAIPEFSIPSRRLFVREFFHMYENYSKMLRKEIATHRVSLTTDTWTSVQNTNYMVITSHFIDSEWKMHKRILSFGEIENHQGVTIGKAIEACLLKWNIEKVSTITVDNASANLTAINWVRTRMNSWDKSKAIMEGEYLHVRCVAHIVNLIVGHGLKVLNRSVLAIRNSVSYVRSSPHRKLEFKKVVEVVKIPCKGSVVLDVPTRWNSTYLMLESSLTFRLAFERMKDDVAYQAYFNNEELVGEFDETVDGLIAPPRIRKRVGPPVDADWDKAEVFVDFLEAFYEVTLRVSSTLRPAANTCFHDIMVIENKLRDLYVPITDHATQKRTELEELLSTMSTRMTSKYEKYFGRHTDMNQLLFVALFLDPRFKLTSVANLFAKEGISDADLKARTTKILDLVKKLYDYYKPPTVDVPSQSSSSSHSLTRIGSTETKGPKKKNLLSLLQNLPVNDDNLVFKHEVDRYLSDKLEFFNGDVELDVLNWWKLHGPKYPVLALMAKDVLAIQVSSVASESAFSTGGRIVDTSRSSLTPKSVEALLCLQDWIKGDHITTYIKNEPSIESYTFYEQCEQEISAAESSTNAPY